MSDFLTRLVDQTLNLAPVVQPLIPPAFSPAAAPIVDTSSEIVAEPAPSEALPTGDISLPVLFEAATLPPNTGPTSPRLVAPIEEGGPKGPEHRRVSVSRTGSLPPDPQELSAPLGAPTSDEPAKRPASNTSEKHQLVSRPQKIHRQKVDSVASLPISPVPPANPAELPVASDSKRDPLAAGVPAAQAPQRVRRVVEPTHRTPETRLETAENPVDVLLPKPVKPLPAPPLTEPTELETPAFASPHKVRVREQPPSIRPVTPTLPITGPRTELKSSAPAIRISIGRIEVRAVTVPAPAPARSTSAPAARLSLDEYLRSQAGGRL